MKTVTYARYYLPPGPGRKTPYPSRYAMSPEDAAAAGALGIVPGTEEVREHPETEEERRRSVMQYQSAGQDGAAPPRK